MDTVERIIVSVVAVAIAMSLIGIIAGQANTMTKTFVSPTNHNITGTNVSGMSAVIVGLLTMVLVIGLIVLSIKYFIKK